MARLTAIVLAATGGGCSTPDPAYQHGIAYAPLGMVEAPAPTVSPAIRAYSGVWQGKWDDKWDVVFVIRRVGADGTADYEYRWIENVGRAFSARQGEADIVAGVFHAGSITLTLDVTHPDRAAAVIDIPRLNRTRRASLHRISESLLAPPAST